MSGGKVVILDHCAQMSGGEIALARLLPALQRYEAHVILAESGPLVAQLQGSGVSVEVLRLSDRTRSVTRNSLGVKAATSAVADLSSYVMRLSKRIRHLNPVLIHGNSLKAGYYGSIVAQLTRRPFVWHLRDRLARDYMPQSRILMTRAVMNSLSIGVVGCSADVLNVAQINPRRRSLVLHDGYRRKRPVADRSALADRFVVGMVGRLASWKGQDVFLRAFAELHQARPAARARIVGSAMFADAAFEGELRALADQLGVSAAVEFTGFRLDVEAELDDIDVLVHASTSPEPFGQVIVEGMAAATPVVAAAAGGPLEIIDSGRDGVLYAPGDHAALALVLLELADNPQRRRRIGEAGAASAVRFEPTRVAQRLEDFWALVERQ